MKLLTVQLPDSHNIFHFGDVHKGSQLSCEAGWEQFVYMTNHKYDGCKNNYGIDGSDMIEAIMVDDKRFSNENVTEPQPLAQMKQAIKDRQRIKSRLLCILQGNHERKLWRFGDIAAYIAKDLGVPYGTFTAKISIVDKHGNLMYKIFETHGRKSINSTADDPKRRKTNLNLILKRHLKFKAADCAVMIKHHTHKLLVCGPEKELYLTDDGNKIQQNYTHWGQSESYIHPDARWYGNAGSFLKLYADDFSGYAEVAEYDPVELGFLVTKVRDRKIVSVDLVYLDI
uniref:Calcineurin-like phosphoesterase domain-containing protein n=1 Tax=viral metagenome TaxID=1070528 RepID=A0A6M3KAI6_9ZZZZ